MICVSPFAHQSSIIPFETVWDGHYLSEDQQSQQARRLVSFAMYEAQGVNHVKPAKQKDSFLHAHVTPEYSIGALGGTWGSRIRALCA